MEQCPCGSGKDLAECCGPLLTGEKQASTAEDLMRSRYTAYVRADVDYLEKTTHPDRRSEFDKQGSLDWAQKSRWLGLDVKKTEAGGPEDEKGQVEFVAEYEIKGQKVRHHEMATFEKKDDAWYFVDGEGVQPETVRRESPKVGRNEPCPCGSGKKYKKCCGA
ncbi:MAG: YchJ family protein [Thermodesulfobacteriota bacterium]